MELFFKRKGKTILILVSGEIDHHTSTTLRLQTENALSQIGGKNIIFDFSQVTFMDSSGIGMLIGRYKQLQALNGRIAIACANEKIGEIIRLAGLKDILPVFSTTEEALSYTEGRDKNAV